MLLRYCSFSELGVLYACTVFLVGDAMKIEVTIDKTNKLPNGAEPALEAEFLRRLNQKYDGFKLSIRRTGTDGLTVFGGIDGDKETIAEILQETWESADD